jgi:type VI secretion system protein ImpH
MKSIHKPLIEELFDRPYEFDFYQAVQILERFDGARVAIGLQGPPEREVVRFRSLPSLNFPPSAIYSLAREPSVSARTAPPPVLTVAFGGMFGPDGSLPTHYTQTIIRQLERGRGDERTALRDWLDLFNHRLLALFYRAWEKYRPAAPFMRYLRARTIAEGGLPGVANTMQVSVALQAKRTDPDPFTLFLYHLIGMGPAPVRNRLQVAVRLATSTDGWHEEAIDRQRLTHIDDLALLYFGGLFIQRPRNAAGLGRLIGEFFGVPVVVEQFSGQWLDVPIEQQTCLREDGNAALGVNVVAGERVWDVVSSFRLVLGPLQLSTYQELLPDLAPRPRRKSFFLLCQLVRLYVGPEFDFEVQLILAGDQVPECELKDSGRDVVGARLGWNTWLGSDTPHEDAGDAFFAGDETSEIPAEAGAR